MIRRLGTILTVAVLGCMVFPAGAADTGERPSVERTFDLALALGRYPDQEDENSDGQSFSLRWFKPKNFDFRLNGGRQQRFGESTLGMGVAYGHFLTDKSKLTVGVSASTGELAPQWSTSVTIRRPFFNNLPLWFGYTHDHWDNGGRQDRFALGGEKWSKHWILEAAARYNMNDPGDHSGWGGNVGLTWYRWKELYIGGGYNFGDVRYEPAGFENVLVEYEARGYYMTLEHWFSPRSGIGFRLGQADNPESYGIRGRWFTKW
ncbi:MAG: YaiO family outer membrane beta-barrel protein [Acidobacteria bacterium]|uniref:YaiO family outer membrane beta-barrel protein n=1 Tax=Candidatus Polarisedimenticola svalbardensis TaxID=2886004 RepID=A0A8J7CER2_9BACT|nr:YaiO family outer membrane beta-barrel protein [Candidatus Polarisedimenticola svalbardensis]